MLETKHTPSTPPRRKCATPPRPKGENRQNSGTTHSGPLVVFVRRLAVLGERLRESADTCRRLRVAGREPGADPVYRRQLDECHTASLDVDQAAAAIGQQGGDIEACHAEIRAALEEITRHGASAAR